MVLTLQCSTVHRITLIALCGPAWSPADPRQILYYPIFITVHYLGRRAGGAAPLQDGGLHYTTPSIVLTIRYLISYIYSTVHCITVHDLSLGAGGAAPLEDGVVHFSTVRYSKVQYSNSTVQSTESKVMYCMAVTVHDITLRYLCRRAGGAASMEDGVGRHAEGEEIEQHLRGGDG